MTLESEILERNRELIRRSLRAIAADKIECTAQAVTDAIKYAEHDDDITLVKDRLKIRGALGIRKSEGATGYEVYTKQRTAEMIESGEYESIVSGTLHRIASCRAQLFNNPTSYFDYTDADGEPVEDAAAILNAHREAGGCKQALCDADYIASVVDSGPLFIDWKAGHLTYTPIAPTKIHFKYHDKIRDNGIERGVDYTDIDDCSAMVLELAGQPSAIDEQSYLAVMGRSDQWPLGRYVYYTGRNWEDIPDPGPNVIDWTTKGGDIANPLSVYADLTMGSCEYPLVVIRGGVTITGGSSPIPTSTTLYECCLEIDVAFSRLLKDSLSCALGLKVISGLKGQNVPTCLEGAVAIHEEGGAVQMLSLPIANTQGALDNVMITAKTLGEGYSCPSYMVVSEASVEPGIALAIRTKPLANELDKRGRLNAESVARLFEIEKGLYSVYAGKDLVPPGTNQVWSPGRFIYPESMLDRATRLQQEMDSGLTSYVRAIMDKYQLATVQQAKELIDKMTEENAEYPAPKSSSQQQTNPLTAGLSPRPPRNFNL